MSLYKTGTVAKATVRCVPDVIVMRDDAGWWVSPIAVEGDRCHGSDVVTDARPLILLDLNRLNGVAGSLVCALRRAANTSTSDFAKIADQIEAQTKPPRIPEPEAIGSVVLAAQVGECDGSERYWTKFRKDGWIDAYDHIRSWDDLDNPIHVRQGVES